jgi:pimeloyl-ACP methyl ester carboxylesterase
MFGHCDMWRTQVDALSPLFRMVAPELPIFDHDFRDCTIEGFADYVLRFMNHARIPRAVLGGNSLGGHVALDIATRFPERCRGLVLAGSSGLFERTFDRVPRTPSREWVWERVRQVFYREEHVPPGTLEEIETTIGPRENKFRLLKVAKSAKGTHMGSLLHRIRVPTLLAWGIQDEITPMNVAREFHEGIAGSRLELFDECGHCPMTEHPERFTHVLGEFLTAIA